MDYQYDLQKKKFRIYVAVLTFSTIPESSSKQKVINNLKFSTVILLQKLLVLKVPQITNTKVQVFKLLFHKNYLWSEVSLIHISNYKLWNVVDILSKSKKHFRNWDSPDTATKQRKILFSWLKTKVNILFFLLSSYGNFSLLFISTVKFP